MSEQPDSPEMVALIDAVLRLKRPALFKGDWRSKHLPCRLGCPVPRVG